MEGHGTAQRLIKYDCKSEDEAVYVQVPVDIQAMRQADMALAVDWRLKAREIFETYFRRGYVAVDFAREGHGGAQRNLYTLWRPPAEWLAALGGA